MDMHEVTKDCEKSDLKHETIEYESWKWLIIYFHAKAYSL